MKVENARLDLFPLCTTAVDHICITEQLKSDLGLQQKKTSYKYKYEYTSTIAVYIYTCKYTAVVPQIRYVRF